MRYWFILLPLLVFIASFAYTYPGVIVLSDEARYIRQAEAFANGNIQVEQVNPLTNETTTSLPSEYPPGTSLSVVPFVAVGGWQAAFWLPALALVMTVFFTVLLLKTVSLPPEYALVILLFPPALVMARVVSSDVISAWVVAIGWWLFWQGAVLNQRMKKQMYWWFGAGLIAGLSILFRETNALLFAPLFLGALIRLNKNWIWLLTGGVIGVFIRLLLAWLIFGDPFFVKDPEYGFSLAAMISNAPLYLLNLMIFVPGGLVFAAAYRGRRRPEVIATVALFVLFYLAYEYSGQTSGLAKRMVLGPRFFIPLLPVFAFVMAESVPRLSKKFLRQERTRRWLARVAFGVILAGVPLTNFAFQEWTKIHEQIQTAIVEKVPAEVPVITNPIATQKFLSELHGYEARLDFHELGERDRKNLDGFYLVFLQRSDSDYWIEEAKHVDAFLNQLSTVDHLDKVYPNNYRLRILQIMEPE